MSTAKPQRHPDPIPDTDEPRRSGCRPLDDFDDEPESSPAPAEPGALSGHALLAAAADKKSPQWQALAARTRALTLSTPAERAAAGEVLDEAVGDLLSVLGHVHYRTGRPSISGAPRLPHDDWPGRAPEQRAGWPDIQHRADRLREVLAAAPSGGVLTERAEAVLALLDPIIAAGLALHESNSAPLPPAPATGYHGEQEPQEDGSGPVPTQKNTTTTTAHASGEVTKRRPPSKLPGYEEPGLKGLVGVIGHVTPEVRQALNEAARQRGIPARALIAEVLTTVAAEFQAGKPMQVKLPDVVSEQQWAAVKKAAKTLAAALR